MTCPTLVRLGSILSSAKRVMSFQTSGIFPSIFFCWSSSPLSQLLTPTSFTLKISCQWVTSLKQCRNVTLLFWQCSSAFYIDVLTLLSLLPPTYLTHWLVHRWNNIIVMTFIQAVGHITMSPAVYLLNSDRKISRQQDFFLTIMKTTWKCKYWTAVT